MGLFSDIEKMGLQVNLDEVYAEENKQVNMAMPDIKESQEKPQIREEDVLFDKGYKCPLCDNQFKVKAVRTGKLKFIEHDKLMRPIYENHIDPMKYDAILCPRCGYAALTRYYKNLTSQQIRTLRTEYCRSFRGIKEEYPILSYEGALLRHKLALICAMKRNAKNSEKAYIFLKMAWLLRGQQEELLSKDPKRIELKQTEMECFQKAYEGFAIATNKESFPICGMDEVSVRYIQAVMAFELEKYEECAKYIMTVLNNKSASARVKDMALALKEDVKAEILKGKK